MQITDETPVKNITVGDFSLAAPMPYAEGHTLTAGEASAMNQLFHENLRNNFGAKLKGLKERGETPTAEKAQEDFTAYAAEYEFGVRKAGGGAAAPSDPVEREALNLAKGIVRQALTSQGYKLKDVGIETIERLAGDLLKSQPKILEEAQRRVDAAKSVGAAALAGLSLPVATEQTAESPAAQG